MSYRIFSVGGFFFFQAEDGIRDAQESRGLGDVYKRQRVGRDAARIAEEVIQHLAGLVGAHVHVTLEIEAEIPDGVPDAVIRTVTENCRVLKFETQEFEEE